MLHPRHLYRLMRGIAALIMLQAYLRRFSAFAATGAWFTYSQFRRSGGDFPFLTGATWAGDEPAGTHASRARVLQALNARDSCLFGDPFPLPC
jgi:hypothetical protein